VVQLLCIYRRGGRAPIGAARVLEARHLPALRPIHLPALRPFHLPALRPFQVAALGAKTIGAAHVLRTLEERRARESSVCVCERERVCPVSSDAPQSEELQR
jgi:hypothetical protein